MKRAFIVLMGLLVASALMAEGHTDAWLFPTVPGTPSRTAPVVKGDEKQVDMWLRYDDNEANYVLVGLGDAETLCVFFEPPAACSVLAMEFCAALAYPVPPTTVEKFIAVSDTSLTTDCWNEYHAGDPVPGPSPILEFVAGPVTSKPIDTVWTWDTLWVDPENIPDVGANPFVAGWIKVLGDTVPNPRITPGIDPPWHALIYRHEPANGGPPGWYSSWHQFWIRALVRVYEDPPPIINSVDKLPWSYTTGPRTVTADVEDLMGIPEDVWGVASATLVYNVNGGEWQTIPMVCVDTIETVGDNIKRGIWAADIPGVGAGDSVSYYVVAEDLAELSTTWSTIYWYKIVAGTPGNIFFYNDDYYGPPNTPDFVGMVYENVDYWDGEVQGTPDESVIGFYTPGKGPGAPVILWNSWGGETFAEAVGAGVIQSFLDAGGNLFMSGQDFLAGLAGTFGQVEWEAGTFPYDYLKFYVTIDDPEIVSPNTYATFYGAPEDTITAPFFEEGIYVWPYIDTLPGWAWYGQIVETDATPIFFYEEGEISGARYESDKGYKYIFLYWPFAYIVEVEADTWTGAYDVGAGKTLVRRILQWFGLEVGVEEEPVAKPAIHVPTVFTNAINISYEVPNELPLDVKLYDLTGRKLDELNIKLTGKGTYSWDASHLPVGVYFMKLDLGDRSTTHKLVKLR
ncbi:MAG: hypothetical protein DRP09_20595 [Candidatus Thorarchaeota archaeon]|nr:MAG: hypothetical protein DRP09_20595 [Candidatus Thorarchaeota archaeon]